jgi:hypothetical protein
VLDTTSGRTYPRVDCLAALTSVACADADADGHPVSEHCPDGAEVDCDDTSGARFPGNAEVCDGLDNDCDGVVPPAEIAPPGPLFNVRLSPVGLEWTSALGGATYDVVTGSLGVLRGTGGSFAAATTACLSGGTTGTTLPLPGVLEAGGSWYLVRAVTCAGIGTYDSGGVRQAAPRDAGIAASGRDCP